MVAFIAQLTLVTAIVIGFLLLAYFVLKQNPRLIQGFQFSPLMPLPSSSESALVIESRLPLDARKSLMIVRAGEERYLIGATIDRIDAITRMGSTSLGPSAAGLSPAFQQAEASSGGAPEGLSQPMNIYTNGNATLDELLQPAQSTVDAQSPLPQTPVGLSRFATTPKSVIKPEVAVTKTLNSPSAPNNSPSVQLPPRQTTAQPVLQATPPLTPQPGGNPSGFQAQLQQLAQSHQDSVSFNRSRQTINSVAAGITSRPAKPANLPSFNSRRGNPLKQVAKIS